MLVGILNKVGWVEKESRELRDRNTPAHLVLYTKWDHIAGHLLEGTPNNRLPLDMPDPLPVSSPLPINHGAPQNAETLSQPFPSRAHSRPCSSRLGRTPLPCLRGSVRCVHLTRPRSSSPIRPALGPRPVAPMIGAAALLLALLLSAAFFLNK